MNTKKLLSAAGLMFIVGLIIFCIGFSRVGWDISALDNAEYFAQTLDYNNPIFNGETQIDELELDIDSFDITIQNGEEFKIDYYTSDDLKAIIKFETKQNKRVLKFELDEAWHTHIGWFSGIKRSKLKVLIVVPQGIELDIDADSSSLSGSGLNFSKVKIDASSANISFNDFTCQEFEFSGGSSNVHLSQFTSPKTKVKTNSGNLFVETSTLGDFEFDGSSATLNCQTVEANKVDVEGNSSFFNLTSVTSDSLNIKGSSASTNIESSQIKEAVTIVGNSSRVDIFELTAKSYIGEGSSCNVVLADINVELLKYTGNSGSLQTNSAISVNTIEFKGSSAGFNITIKGSLEDFASISMTGSSSKYRINDEKFSGAYSGSGTKTLTMSGNSSSCYLYFE